MEYGLIQIPSFCDYQWIFLHWTNKAWEWLTKTSNWENLEKNMGPDSFKSFLNPMHLVIKNKKTL